MRSVSPPSAAALPTLLSVMFINMVGFGVIVPLLPFYAESFQAPAWQIALVFSAYSIGAFFGEPFWGRLSDRIGRKPVLIYTVSANCVCYLALAFAPNIQLAFLVRLLGGMAAGNGSVIQGYICDVTPAGEREGRISLVSAAYNAGFIVGPALGGWLANPAAGHAGFRTPLFFAAALSVLCVAGLARFVVESRVHVDTLVSRPNRWAVVGAAIVHPVIGRLLLVTFLGGFAFSGIESIFGLWTQARLNWGPHQIGSAFGIVGVVAAFCQIALTGRLAQRFGARRVIGGGMAITVVCFALQPFSTGAAMTIVLLAGATFGQAISWPTIAALISQNADPRQHGQYLGLNNAAGAAARLAGPLVLGLGFSAQVDLPFWFAAVAVVPAIGLAFLARMPGRSAAHA